MHPLLFVLVLCPLQSGEAYYSVPLEELELAPNERLPSYGGYPPWVSWDGRGLGVANTPWVALDGAGEARLRIADPNYDPAGDELRSLGSLVAHTQGARELKGTLFLPKASGGGFLRLAFRVPAARATASEADFLNGELEHALRQLRAHVPGSAWFRHRHDALRARLGTPTTAPDEWAPWMDFRQPVDALGLFSGGRALYENLQLERGLPESPEAEATVALDSLEGLTVRPFDWAPRLAAGENALDPLAALIPADQHALFFPSFESFVATLDAADEVGTVGLAVFEERSADAHTRARYERQLGLELSALARALGSGAVASVALTGSDLYLRTGSDLALLFRPKLLPALQGYLAARQAALGGKAVEGQLGSVAYRGVVDATRRVSYYLASVRDVVVVSNSLQALERIVRVAEGAAPALAQSGDYRFFRQRYALGAAGEAALAVLPDEAIRRWCSPRWRIASARLARAAAALAEEHAVHADELLGTPVRARTLGVDAEFAELGELSLTADGIHSTRYGTLDFLTPIAELPLERVSEREAGLYRTWKEGYEQAWSNYFDPIGARLALEGRTLALDLTVMPLIFGTEYAELRKMSAGHVLAEGSGDPHPEALVHFVLGLDPEWEPLKSLGSVLGSTGEKLGVDLLAWLGGWVTLFVDEGAFWDDLLQAEGLDEVLEGAQAGLNQIPLALEVAVKNPLKLALFMTSLRAFADGTAPGMTEWKERVVGERRFVQIGSPGLGQEFSLFYATTPTALILSLHEPTLLVAMAREERRRAGEALPGGPWTGSHAGLALSGRGIEILETLFQAEAGERLQRECWRNLPILNEWKRLHPARDPLEVHERLFRERLACPSGGTYVWNEAWHTMESSVLGHPGEPKHGARRPAGWDDLVGARFALEFEPDGLRVRAELERR